VRERKKISRDDCERMDEIKMDKLRRDFLKIMNI